MKQVKSMDLKIARNQLQKLTDELETCINNSTYLSDKEKKHRIKNLRTAKEDDINGKVYPISNRYVQLAHEIKSMDFISNFGNISVALDSQAKAGCDILLDNYYQIECVCCSSGNSTFENKLREYQIFDGSLVDYKEKKKLLNSRLTSVIESKKEFYYSHVEKKTISSDKPYIIFISLGTLAYDMFLGENGIEFLDILLGKGDLKYIYDNNLDKIVDATYTHEETLEKWNGAKLNCNIFQSTNYACISSIILTDANIYEKYDLHNTWMFLNPLAQVPLEMDIFLTMNYWEIEQGKYICRDHNE